MRYFSPPLSPGELFGAAVLLTDEMVFSHFNKNASLTIEEEILKTPRLRKFASKTDECNEPSTLSHFWWDPIFQGEDL